MKRQRSILMLIILCLLFTTITACTAKQDPNSKLSVKDVKLLKKHYNKLNQDELTRLTVIEATASDYDREKYKSDLKRLYIEHMTALGVQEETAEKYWNTKEDYRIRKANGQLTQEEKKQEKEIANNTKEAMDKINSGANSADAIKEAFEKSVGTAISNDIFLPVCVNGKWGYIDTSGKIVCNPQFKFAFRYYNGLARVAVDTDQGEKYGYIDKKFNIIIKPQFDNANDFSDGMARVEISGKTGFINIKGEMTIKPQYDRAEDFSDGTAPVIIFKEGDFMHREDKWGYIDKTGQFIIPPKYISAEQFLNGIALVNDDGKWIYINKDSKEILKGSPSAGIFHENLAYFYKTNLFSEEYGYIDKNGKMLITINKISISKKKEALSSGKLELFNFLKDFSEGLAAVKTNAEQGSNVDSKSKDLGTKWGYIDTKGKVIIKPIYDKANNFYEGIAEVEIDGISQYIDKNGKIIGNVYRQ